MRPYGDGIETAVENRKHHAREADRLRSLAATVTTTALKARILEQAQEHARLAGIVGADGATV
jgi:hypothetical protein